MRRRGLLLLAGALAGAAVAAAVVLLEDPTYRADASVALARQGQPPGSDPALAEAAEAAADLFESRTVAESVVANLRLDASPDALLDRVEISAEPDTSLVHVEADAPTPDEARRLAQAVTEVATVLYNDRFGPETTASVWEAPRVDEAPLVSSLALPVLFGAAVGGAAGLAAAVVAGRRPRWTFRSRGRRGWTLPELERAAAEADDADDRRLYLDALRDYADDDGSLDPAFDELVEEVFGDTLPARR